MRPADRTFAAETDAQLWLTVTESKMVRDEWIDPDAVRMTDRRPAGRGSGRFIRAGQPK
jgi:hypothetical protein